MIERRVLIVEDKTTDLYLVESFREKFDKVIVLEDYLVPSELVTSSITPAGRIPTKNYDASVTPKSGARTAIKAINKKEHTKIRELNFGDNTAYFVVGKKSWYYIRDFHKSHVGLRGGGLDWQVVHLNPFTMGTNKFVFCHEMTDEYFEAHNKYFFNDDVMNSQVKELEDSNMMIVSDADSMLSLLQDFIDLDKGTRFGLDYETNGFYRDNQYENLLVIGVGISTVFKGVYFEFRDLSEEDLNIVKAKYKEFLVKHSSNSWVFNTKFEVMVTRKFLGDWNLYRFNDADIWRIMYGNQIGYSKKKKVVKNRWTKQTSTITEKVVRDWFWNLKFTAQKYLNVGSWDDEFDYITSELAQVFKGCNYTIIDDLLTCPIIGDEIHKLADTPKTVTKINGRKAETVLKLLMNKKKIKTEQDIIDLLGPKTSYDFDKFKIAILGTNDTKEILDHYKFKLLEKKYPKHVIEFKKRFDDPRIKGNEYATIPTDLVGKYCILDSYYTLMIAEKHIKDDFFTPKGDRKRDVGSSGWMTTEKLADIFNRNKSLGAYLDLFGLYKSNTKLGFFDKIQLSIRLFTNWMVAKHFYNIKLVDSLDLKPSKNESLLEPIFLKILKSDNPDISNFNKITQKLFPLVYDDMEPYRWSDSKAEDVFGSSELAEEMKEVLLDHKPKGFINPGAFARSINLHKDTGAILQDLWDDQDLPKDFKVSEITDYYTKMSKVMRYKYLTKSLDSFNIVGRSIEEIVSLDKITYTDVEGIKHSVDHLEAVSIMKSSYFDIATATELSLSVWFENNMKDFRVLLAMYDPSNFKDLIDSLHIFDKQDSIKSKIKKFKEFVISVAMSYEQPKIINWEAALRFAKENEFPSSLSELSKEQIKEMEDKLLANTYIDKVISYDIQTKFGVTKPFMDKYMWYHNIDADMLKDDKETLEKYKSTGILSYVLKSLEKGKILSVYDSLDPSGNLSYKKFSTCNSLDKGDISELYYPIMATAFKMYRKADKIGQYIHGQLTDFDQILLGEGEDSVPILKGFSDMSKSDYKGDNVKMFPLYEIMLKFTKRNSAGIHTVPSGNEIKGVIVAQEDSYLVYTDISSMELRGIAAIAKDPVMIDYFEQGKDIYTEAAVAYHNGILNKNMLYDEIYKQYRKSYKTGVLQTAS